VDEETILWHLSTKHVRHTWETCKYVGNETGFEYSRYGTVCQWKHKPCICSNGKVVSTGGSLLYLPETVSYNSHLTLQAPCLSVLTRVDLLKRFH